MAIDLSSYADKLYPTAEANDIGYLSWLALYKVNPTPDYNTYGAYKAGMKPDARGHLNDLYKNDNHITYSTESLASQKKGAKPAGEWLGNDKDGWTFKATQTNIENAGGIDNLKKYFEDYEQGVKLLLPGDK